MNTWDSPSGSSFARSGGMIIGLVKDWSLYLPGSKKPWCAILQGDGDEPLIKEFATEAEARAYIEENA